MDRRTANPIFPNAPKEYTARWASELVRALDQLSVILRNPGEGRFTQISITDLPTSDYGLEAGTVFRQGNLLLVSLPDQPYATGFQATGRVGTVTVTV